VKRNSKKEGITGQLFILLVVVLILEHLAWADQVVKQPPLDAQERFWVYREKEERLPFIPHGWMPAEAAKMIEPFDLGHTDNPHSGKTCLAVTVKWKFPWWCGIVWITKDKWWGECDDPGPVYNLTGVKELIVWAMGKKGGERIQFEVATLADKPCGDSTGKKIKFQYLTLTKEWTEYRFDLTKLKPPPDFSRIAAGFTFVLSIDEQQDEAAPVSFFLDDIYYCFGDCSLAVVSPQSKLTTTWAKMKQGI